MKKYIIVVIIALGFLLSGCSANAEMEPYLEENQGNYSDENTDLEDSEPTSETQQPTNQGGETTVSNDISPALLNRKIIYTANLHMDVINPTSVYNDVLTTLDSYTAYIEEANITTNRYEITIRVLSTEFDDFVEDIKTSGELVSYSKTSEDVTNTYSTYESKIAALETKHARILELISGATDLDTILMLEEERYQIESDLNFYGDKLENFDSLIDYSTVTLLITEAKEEIIVLPRTEDPSVIFTEITKDTITLEITNKSDENVTLHVDVYQNGEFVTEYEENVFGDSKTVVSFEQLKSNKEYTFKVTALANDHRVSLVDTYVRETEKTYGNKTTNTFIESVNILVQLFEFIGLAITALLPFAVVGFIFYYPLRKFVFKKKLKLRLKRVNKPSKEE